MLSRASYPDLWTHWGYPPRPSQAALIGDVVHGVLELLLRALRAGGCASLADPRAVGVLKSLGGYTKLVEAGIDQQLEQLVDNPRFGDRLTALRSALRIKVPEIRQRVQAVITRTAFEFVASDPPKAGSGTERGPLAPGFYPEVDLRVPELRLAGRADLVHVAIDGCEITDYKTGAPDPHHADQLRLYALLWTRDLERNPKSLPVTRLVLAYSSHDVAVDPPSIELLEGLADTTAAAITAAETALRERPPPAHREPDVCGSCGVRQLCTDYWLDPPKVPVANQAGTDGAWFDFEGTVIERNGPRSWLVESTGNQERVLLRTPTELVPFRVGDHVRLLNLYRESDPELTSPIASFSHFSEAFTLTPDI